MEINLIDCESKTNILAKFGERIDKAQTIEEVNQAAKVLENIVRILADKNKIKQR
jgi:hypothetical protein